MDYKFSLIIPHYNNQRLLNRLLESIPKRTALQVIVVDDCSNKDVEKLEKLKYHYHYIEWYSTGLNGGGGNPAKIIKYRDEQHYKRLKAECQFN